MNTLSFPAILSKAGASKPMIAAAAAFQQEQFPLEIEAAEGSLAAVLIAGFYQTSPGGFLVVVPSETEAGTLASDLKSLGAPSMLFPWWGTEQYRPMPRLSPVFGERTKILSNLVLGNSVIVIVPERAFLTPVPPPAYIQNLLITLKPGGTIDTRALSEILVSYGYTRVPKVQMQGEFALRGEVLDLRMGGDDEAYRILFDFDTVDSIKRFDPLDQSGLEKVPELLIRPLKEVIWSDERIEGLSRNLADFEEFSKNGGDLLEDLMVRGWTRSEERRVGKECGILCR
ncbi:MAG: transcription-repair coupling factor, partial [Treponema sp.]|nr:transcription-repair coupling factor [Treponema sp.]